MKILEFLKKVKKYLSFKSLAKKYHKYAVEIKKDIDVNYDNLPHENPDKIFVCWLQGMENAPDIVKICYNSLKANNADKDVIVITEDNYAEYVEFPQFILEKYKKGCFSKTHFSDLLRLELLIKYGGCWVDSTAFFTDSIPDYILNQDLFMFQDFSEHTLKTTSISSWFIKSCSNNSLLILERALLYRYWKKHNKLKNYFLFHKIFTSIVVKIYYDEWKKTIMLSNKPPKVLDCYLFEPYNKEQYDFIARGSFIHKFMYKYSQEQFEMKNTYYDWLRQKYLKI